MSDFFETAKKTIKPDELISSVYSEYVSNKSLSDVTISMLKDFLDSKNSVKLPKKDSHKEAVKIIKAICTTFCVQSIKSIMSNVRIIKTSNLVTFIFFGIDKHVKYTITDSNFSKTEDFDIFVANNNLKTFIPVDFSHIEVKDTNIFFDDDIIPIVDLKDKLPELVDITDVTFSKSTTIETSKLKKLLPFVSKSESRRFACGVCIDKNYLVATDGRSLLKYDLVEDTGFKNHLISFELSNFLCSNVEKFDYLIESDNNLTTEVIRAGNLEIVFSKYEGNFPPYEVVIPKDEEVYDCLEIKKDEFLSISKYVDKLCDKKTPKAIIDESKIKLVDSDGVKLNLEKELDFLKDNTFTLAVNYKNLSDAFSITNNLYLKLLIKNAQSTLIVRDPNDVNFY